MIHHQSLISTLLILALVTDVGGCLRQGLAPLLGAGALGRMSLQHILAVVERVAFITFEWPTKKNSVNFHNDKDDKFWAK